MAEIVLDANILVAQLDANDSLHAAAVDLIGRLEGAGHRPVLLSAKKATVARHGVKRIRIFERDLSTARLRLGKLGWPVPGISLARGGSAQVGRPLVSTTRREEVFHAGR